MRSGLTFRFYETHSFGDLWRAVSHCLRVSEWRGQPVFLQVPAEKVVVAENIAKELDSKGQFQAVTEGFDTAMTGDVARSTPTLPTKTRWKGGVSNTITYQFDGITDAALKNPPVEDWFKFREWAVAKGFDVLNVSGAAGWTLKQQVKLLSQARFHVACVSGFYNVAYAVGIPVNLCAYRFPALQEELTNWHAGQTPKLWRDLDDFMANN